MIVRVLGSAAGGGLPQWNCNCANCGAARSGKIARRTQSCVAVSADSQRWLLLNCSPDIAQQIEAFAPLQPHERRGTPIAGMLFTDANVDHMGGLATLRQAGEHRFVIRSSQIVRDIAASQPGFEPFTRPPHRWLPVSMGHVCEPADDEDVVGTAIRVRAFRVAGVTPGYDGRRAVEGATVAYELQTREGATLLFAPVFADLTGDLARAIERADAALIDGSFYTNDEMLAMGLMPKTAQHLGHFPVVETLARLNGAHRRVIFTHLNNSNPMLDPESEAAARVRAAGVEVAYDGLEFRL